MPPPPQQLPDELVEEVLLRFPPEEPAGLVRTGLVCRRWCRLVSDPGFRRRFCEFHRSPPMLGMLYNLDDTHTHESRFMATMAFCSPHADRRYWRVLDARHGRGLLLGNGNVLLVWDPLTDEVRELPFPQKILGPCNAAVLCSAAGVCGHLDCHHGPFLVVVVCSQHLERTLVYTYSSDAAAWSEPAVYAQLNYIANYRMGIALVGNCLYFGNVMGSTALKYDLELCQVSLILLPSLRCITLQKSLLTNTEDGGLGLVYKDDSKLCMWSRKDTPEVDAKWERRVIKLKKVFPVDVDVAELGVIGSGVGIIFVRTGDEIYTIDLKTHEVKKVFQGTTRKVIPYTSFYTPALKGTCTSEGPSVGHSSA